MRIDRDRLVVEVHTVQRIFVIGEPHELLERTVRIEAHALQPLVNPLAGDEERPVEMRVVTVQLVRRQHHAFGAAIGPVLEVVCLDAGDTAGGVPHAEVADPFAQRWIPQDDIARVGALVADGLPVVDDRPTQTIRRIGRPHLALRAAEQHLVTPLRRIALVDDDASHLVVGAAFGHHDHAVLHGLLALVRLAHEHDVVVPAAVELIVAQIGLLPVNPVGGHGATHRSQRLRQAVGPDRLVRRRLVIHLDVTGLLVGHHHAPPTRGRTFPRAIRFNTGSAVNGRIHRQLHAPRRGKEHLIKKELLVAAHVNRFAL